MTRTVRCVCVERGADLRNNRDVADDDDDHDDDADPNADCDADADAKDVDDDDDGTKILTITRTCVLRSALLFMWLLVVPQAPQIK